MIAAAIPFDPLIACALSAIALAWLAAGLRLVRGSTALGDTTSPLADLTPVSATGLGLAAIFAALACLLGVDLRGGGPPMQTTAVMAAAAAAVAALFALVGARRGAGRFADHAGTIALILGTTAGTTEAIILAMRLLDSGVELATGSLSFQPASYGFAPVGLTALALLALTTAALDAARPSGRSAAALVWLAAGAAAWAALLAPVVVFSPGGRLIRTSTTFAVMIGLTVVAAAAAAVRGLHRRSTARRSMSPASWPGYRFVTAALSLTLTALCLYHLAAAVPLGGGHRVAAIVIVGCAAVGAWSSWIIAAGPWSLVHYELSLGLASVAMCAALAATAPRYGLTIEERFPLIFVAAAVGMALATVTWTHAAARIEGGARPAWADAEMAVDMRKATKRFAFTTAAIGALIASLLALWPTRPEIGVTEDTLERFTVGLVAHLVLLLALLYCGRRLRRATFSMLTVLVLCSTLGFVAIRMLPWARTFG